MSRTLSLYLSTLLVFGIGLCVILLSGAALQSGRSSPPTERRAGANLSSAASSSLPEEKGGVGLAEGLRANLRHPLSLLLLQTLAILAATRAMGRLFRKIRQPAVIGEMAAGILLGPSLLGALSPTAYAFLFPAASLDSLHLFSQIGVILFMFAVGMEMEAGHLRKQAHTAVLVSHVGILLPFLLGALLALWLYRPLAPGAVSFHAFALFLGVAMSITAFPVLARILEERGLSNAPIGHMAIACAAIGDVTAWCILAPVVAITKAQSLATALLPASLTLLFIGFMLFVLRPWIRHRIDRREWEPGRENGIAATALMLLLASAWFAETIGIHALFGAFLAGAVLPPDARLRAFLRDRLTLISTTFLLPLFFAFTGLRTQIGLLNDPMNWLYGAAIIFVAILGKLGGTLLAARLSGLSWPEGFTLGALMNARGLIELIVLNIGYDLGVLSPPLFTMMVLMALTTTFMTGPLLSLAALWRQRAPRSEQAPSLP